MGKNGDTELKAAALLTLDDITRVVNRPESSIQAVEVYIGFLLHCYVDTDVEMIRDPQTLNKIWDVFNALYHRIQKLCNVWTPEDESFIATVGCELINVFFTRCLYDDHLCVDLAQRQATFSELAQALRQMQERSDLNKQSRFVLDSALLTLVNVANRCGVALAVEPSSMPQPRSIICAAPNAVKFGAQWKQGTVNRRNVRSINSQDLRSLVDSLQEVINKLDGYLKPLIEAEFSVLVDVLHSAQRVFPKGSEPAQRCLEGKFIERMVGHCKQLLKDQHETLCVRLLQTLRTMLAIEVYENTRAVCIRENLLKQFLGDASLSKSGNTITGLFDLQCSLDRAGASRLVFDLIVLNPSPRVFNEAVKLAIALLNGGNTFVQASFHNRFTVNLDESAKFMRVFLEKMQLAQLKLRSTSVMTGDQLMARTRSPSSSRKNSVHSSTPVKQVMDSTLLQRTESSVNDAVWNDVMEERQIEPEKMNKSENEIYPEVVVMEPILRFLQLLCENHNLELQNFIRHQDHPKTNYNLLNETLTFLDILCGSTTGSLGLLGLYINETNHSLLQQTLVTLTEYCQGPCQENQNAIAIHEQNGLDMIISLVLHEIRPLADHRYDLVLEIKSNASKLLLAIMESRDDSENAFRILSNMNRMAGGAKQLVTSIEETFRHQNTDMPTISATSNEFSVKQTNQNEHELAREVGHNVYILALQLSRHNGELNKLLQPDLTLHSTNANDALNYFKDNTASIEISRGSSLERIIFPVPDLCQYLTRSTGERLINTAKRDEQGSKIKIEDFFQHEEEIFDEMRWQRQLRDHNRLFWLSQNMKLWCSISYFLAFLVNVILAVGYPFTTTQSSLSATTAVAVEFVFGLAICTVVTMQNYSLAAKLGTITIILHILYWLQWQGVLILIEIIQIANKVVHIISVNGNHGSYKFEGWTWKAIVHDHELISMFVYLSVCVLGLVAHPFFNSMLLLDVVLREDTLRNVIRSVTRNWRSIALTALLALILLYMFAMIGYVLFPGDYLMERDSGLCKGEACEEGQVLTCDAMDKSCKDSRVLTCDSLWGCLIETVWCGLRNGGGVGDCLRRRAPDEPLFLVRALFDLLFFFCVIIIVLNLIFGVIIDTFADLRSEKQEHDDVLRNTCFLCGLERSKFDYATVSFKEHVHREHFAWNYIYFLVLLRVKDSTEFTGPESYVYQQMRQRKLDWVPRLRCMSLAQAQDETAQADQWRQLTVLLQKNTQHVQALQNQLNLLHQKMLEQRTRKDRAHLLHQNSSVNYS